MSNDDLRVLAAMLEDTMAWHYGLGLSEVAGIAAGTIYPTLARLENSGWLESRWEIRDSQDEGRPRRRLYRMTGLGERMALVHAAETSKRPQVKRRPRLGSLLPGLEAS